MLPEVEDVEEYAELLSACFMLASSVLLFDPEDGGDISFRSLADFHQTMWIHIAEYVTLYS
jgi:hypothetical protein